MTDWLIWVFLGFVVAVAAYQIDVIYAELGEIREDIKKLGESK